MVMETNGKKRMPSGYDCKGLEGRGYLSDSQSIKGEDRKAKQSNRVDCKEKVFNQICSQQRRGLKRRAM
jgi:hypothetical protein